jgi:trypsin
MVLPVYYRKIRRSRPFYGSSNVTIVTFATAAAIVGVLLFGPVVLADRYLNFNGTSIIRAFPPADENNNIRLLWANNYYNNTTSINTTNIRQRQNQARIIGGDTAATYEFPSFAFNGCGGTLIRSDLVLTAAHCQSLFEETKLVYIGTTINPTTGTTSQGEAIAIEKIIPHSKYSWDTNENDIMILKLACKSRAPLQKLNWSTNIPAVDDPAVVVGYGATKFGDKYTTQLNKVQVSIVDGVTCHWLYQGWINNRIMICAGDTMWGGKDACGGDSGGPLLTSDGQYQVGIVSFGWDCGLAAYPGVYTRISPYRRWIGRVIKYYSKPNGNYC